ncbi:MAG: hypothetical protein GXY72_00260 [Deltaproteobacteria bacterium]|nr:hypothetical protein [Deltaproteobacteria bacterium]
MQEILVVAAIAAAIFFLPRLMGRKSPSDERARPQPRPRSQPQVGFRLPQVALTGWMRLAIVITFLWVVGVAAYLKPWEGGVFVYFLVALGPAVVLWGGIWAWFGYKKYRR